MFDKKRGYCSMKKKFVEIGRIMGARGLRGELKVEHWCDSPASFFGVSNYYLEEGREKLDIVSYREYKTIILINIRKVTKKDYAKSLIGKIIYASRDDIEVGEGRYLIQDVIGTSVVDARTEEVYGEICDIIQTGSNDVYVGKSTDGTEFLIPAIGSVVKDIDIDEKRVSITPMEGLLEECRADGKPGRGARYEEIR
jgi:16S rRNA processing protein RimM